MNYQPPYSITPAIVTLIAEISETLGRLLLATDDNFCLRRSNRIRTIQGSLAIEGNNLTEEQITAVLAGKPVVAPPREIQEVRNALAAYDQLGHWQAHNERDLLQAHRLLMQGLMVDAGNYRSAGVGVVQGKQVIHMAPPAKRVPGLMRDLLAWLRRSEEHPLIRSSVFHYEFEFIHPFADGNGRMGRLWQTLLLSQWKPLFAWLPVESMVHAHQAGYYQALQQSTERADSAPFIAFILQRILEVCHSHTPQVKRLLTVIHGEMSREALMQALGLKDAKHFRQHYLLPALSANLIEMTQPDSPSSPTQKYRLTAKGSLLTGTTDENR